MKTTTLILILFLTALELRAQPSPGPRRLPQRANTRATNTPPLRQPCRPPIAGFDPATAPGARVPTHRLLRWQTPNTASTTSAPSRKK